MLSCSFNVAIPEDAIHVFSLASKKQIFITQRDFAEAVKAVTLESVWVVAKSTVASLTSWYLGKIYIVPEHDKRCKTVERISRTFAAVSALVSDQAALQSQFCDAQNPSSQFLAQ